LKKNGEKRGATGKQSTEKAREVIAHGKVGKGSPPEEFKWQPGRSGNPSGKPSAHREVIVQAVKDMLAQVDPKLNKSLFERLLEQCARRALQGSKWHMGTLLDYGLGKPAQAVDLTGTFSFTDLLTRIQARRAALPAATPGNGHTDTETALIAEAMPEDAPAVERGPIKRVVV
jgi:uncharacterized protein DUF5681